MMRKIYSIALMMLVAATAGAQRMFTYGLEVTNQTYTPLTDATVIPVEYSGEEFKQLVIDGTGTSNYVGPITEKGFPIGFDFNYNGKAMNQFMVATDGYIVLGQDEVTSTVPYNPYTVFDNGSDVNVIGMAAIGSVVGQETSELSYKLEGTAPERVLVVQFKDIGISERFNFETKIVTKANLQIRLYEATGNISMTCSGWKPMEGADMSFMSLKVGILGNVGDRLMLNDFEGKSTTTTDKIISYSETEYPVDGVTYTFSAPEPCFTPTTQPTAMKLSATDNSIFGSFEPAADADSYLVLLSADNELTALPEDGKLYTGTSDWGDAGDSIGTAVVVSASEAMTFKSSTQLEANTKYYVFAFAYNAKCADGPLYNTANPLMGEMTTVGKAPEALVVTSADYSEITLKLTDSGQQALVAYTDVQETTAWGMFFANGVFGVPTGQYAPGDTIAGGGKVLYMGSSTDEIKVEGLEKGKKYFFRAWTTDGSNYSEDKLDASAMTASDLPWVADFSCDEYGKSPIGWSCEGVWAVSRDLETVVNEISGVDEANGTVQWIETPYMYLSNRGNRIVADVDYVDRNLASFENGGELKLQVTEDGVNYTDVLVVNKDNGEGFNSGMQRIRARFHEFTGKKVRVRLYLRSFRSTKLTLRGLMVEEIPECDYPVNVAVSAVAGDKAVVNWDVQGEEDHWQVSYKKCSDADWGEPITVDKQEYTLTGLESFAMYTVRVRAMCSQTSLSQWSDSCSFTSGLAVPFALDLSAVEETINTDEWLVREGELADSTALSYGSSWYLRPNAGGFIFSTYSDKCNAWLLTPLFDVGADKTLEHIVSFELTNLGEGYGGVSTDAVIKVVAAEDGKPFSTSNVLFTLSQAEFPVEDTPTAYEVAMSGFEGNVRLGFYVTATDGPAPGLTLNSLAVKADSPVGIDGVMTGGADGGKTVVALYNASGVQVGALQKGINIIRYSDGTSRKVFVK